MKMLEMIIKEYLSVVSYLEDTEPVINDRIIIDRALFKELLEKYQYLRFKEKTKVYKALNLIVHDDNTYTMPIKDKVTKRIIRKVVINYSTYKVLKEL